MSPKTDDMSQVGMHVWEVCGYGKAPFHFAGYEYRVYRAHPEAPALPGATCQACGAGIMNVCTVRSVDGRTFVVGPECINKTGEKGILEAYKKSPAYRQRQRDQRWELARRKYSEIEGWLKDPEITAYLSSMEHPYRFTDRSTGRPLTYLDYADWTLGHGGMQAWSWLHKLLKKIIEDRKGER